MKSTTAESIDRLPFSFDERFLVRSSSARASPAAATTKTVRLESLAQWKDDAWIHPFSDIDILSSLGSNEFGKRISRIQMSISSHGNQRFPGSSNGLDDIPVLPRWCDYHNDDEGSVSSVRDNEQYLSRPQGFSLTIRTVDGLSLEEEARAVHAVFKELIRRRLLTTPVTGGEWDIIEDNEGSREKHSSPRLYQIILPFDGAAWSSDALAQSFRSTLPRVCENGGGENNDYRKDRFFGWNALEWSNFLVGYKDGGGELGRGENQSWQHLTYNKLMWWTWISSPPRVNKGNHYEESLSFGIQYQTSIPSNAKDWLPDNFVDETSLCPIGKRSNFEVFPLAMTNAVNGYQMVSKTTKKEEKVNEKLPNMLKSNFLYSVGVEQVLRRHHTNQGRFESSVDLNPLFDLDDDNSPSCRMKYRQVLPDFLTPMWRSLHITDGNEDNDTNDSNAFYTSSNNLKASVEWNPEDQNSILTIEAVSGPNHTEPKSSSSSSQSLLPSTIFISLEYTPSFLTIDDFPGDPNRGRVLPPSRVSVRCDPSTTLADASTTTIVYSNSLLLLPPVPDLSMPFNVISLTSSLYAYIVGAMVTILVRKGSEKIKYMMYPDRKPKSKLVKLKEKLREKVNRFKSKLFLKKNSNDTEI